jgi:hypothetical protein
MIVNFVTSSFVRVAGKSPQIFLCAEKMFEKILDIVYNEYTMLFIVPTLYNFVLNFREI